MAIKKIIQIGHPALKAQNNKISSYNNPILKRLVKDLTDAMIAGDLIGVAAPQIAKNYTVFVTQPRKTKLRTGIGDKLRVYINPAIIEFSSEKSIIFEGCGSVLNGQLFGPVSRPKEIVIEAYDLQGKKFRLRCDGILARVIQHEYDHLSGIEFLEKISDYKQIMNSDFYRKNIRKSKNQIEASKINIVEFEFI
ncbi:peptide deformylase [Candidatus Roizmanbacteria bacterium]|nr:peptide deformylase [Candidatus Roizmanbacteria bacterium]